VRLKLYKENIIVVGRKEPKESLRPENRDHGRRRFSIRPERCHRICPIACIALENPSRAEKIRDRK